MISSYKKSDDGSFQKVDLQALMQDYPIGKRNIFTDNFGAFAGTVATTAVVIAGVGAVIKAADFAYAAFRASPLLQDAYNAARVIFGYSATFSATPDSFDSYGLADLAANAASIFSSRKRQAVAEQVAPSYLNEIEGTIGANNCALWLSPAQMPGDSEWTGDVDNIGQQFMTDALNDMNTYGYEDATYVLDSTDTNLFEFGQTCTDDLGSEVTAQ